MNKEELIKKYKKLIGALTLMKRGVLYKKDEKIYDKEIECYQGFIDDLNNLNCL